MTDPVVYALALVPALLWGFSPILSKRGMAGGGSSLQAALVVVVVDSALYWTVLFALEGGHLFTDLSLAAVVTFGLAGIVGTALGRVAVFAGVHRVGASINSAGISTRPLFATLLALGFLGETVSLATAAGVAVLVAGLVVLTVSKGGDIGGWEPSDLAFPLAAALAFAVGNVARRYGLLAFPHVTVLEAVAINETAGLVGLGAFLVATGRLSALDAPRRTYGFFAASGTLTAVALLSLFAAFQRAPVALVDPLAGTAPLFTTVFTAVLLRDLERVTLRTALGAVFIVVGAGMITAL